MRILIATDAWHPQVNGVVRTLTSLARSAAALGADIEFLTPDGFPSMARSDLSGPAGGAGRTGARSPGGSRRRRRMRSISRPKARSAGRCGPIAAAASLLSRPPIRRAFRNISRCARSFRPCVQLCGAAAFSRRRRHDHGRDRLAAGRSLPRAVSGSSASGAAGSIPICSGPTQPAELDLPRPIFMTMGRVAVEKNLEAFLVAGPAGIQGRDRRRTAARRALSAAIRRSNSSAKRRAADLSVASGGGRRVRVSEPHRHLRRRATGSAGLRHAGRGVPGHRAARRDRGPSDRRARMRTCASACIRALGMSREACRNFALERSWENSARQFIGNLSALQPSRSLRPARRMAGRTAVRG